MEIGGLPLGDGKGIVLFETDESDEVGPQRVSNEDKAVETFQQALERVHPAVSRVVQTLQQLAPGAVEVEFGIKLTGEAGAIFAKVATEGHLHVKASWAKPADGQGPR
jgi:hypothetical protein